MQVSVESTGGLERRMTVEVPAERVEQEVENRLKSLARTVRLDGFRPGKVPIKVVKQKFGRQVEDEVAQEVMNSTFQEAVTQENLRLAGSPRLEPGERTSSTFQFTATFEVYPDLELAPVGDITIEKPQVEISEQDVDAMIEKLRLQRATWNPVGRPAQKGDQVVIDFEGTIDGEPFQGGQASGATLELGSGRMIPGFEEGLIGAAAGEERTLDLTFPDDYHNAELAGRPVQFRVRVNSVSEQSLPEVDAEFAKSFGIEDGSIETLRQEVRANMERELEQSLSAVVKERAFGQLLARNPVDVPSALVEEEIDRLMASTSQDLGGQPGMGLPRQLFEDRARRRVSLGLLLNEIVTQNGIVLDPDRVRRVIENFAAGYENPDEVIRWYYENQDALASAQTLALEEQVLEWVLDQVQVDEKPCTFDELMELRKAAGV